MCRLKLNENIHIIAVMTSSIMGELTVAKQNMEILALHLECVN